MVMCHICRKEVEKHHGITINSAYVKICLDCSNKRAPDYLTKKDIEYFVVKLENRHAYLNAVIESGDNTDTDLLNERKLINLLKDDLGTLETFHEES